MSAPPGRFGPTSTAGHRGPPTGEHLVLLDRLVLTGFGREHETDIQIPTGTGHVTPRPEIYQPCLKRMARGPMPFAKMRGLGTVASQPLPEVLQVIAFMATGIAHPTPNHGTDAGRLVAAHALNHEISQANRLGANIANLVAPTLGSAITIDVMESLLLPELEDSREPALPSLVERMLGDGRNLLDGHPGTTLPPTSCPAMRRRA